MNNSTKQEMTTLLKNLNQGDENKQNKIIKILYHELRGFV